jgi:hypothetical protein
MICNFFALCGEVFEPWPGGVVSLEPEIQGNSRRNLPNRLSGRHGGRPYEKLRFLGRRRAGHPFDFPQGREALERRARQHEGRPRFEF